ncbi:MAG: TolC family protein, partial [Bacteroidota bacterium]
RRKGILLLLFLCFQVVGQQSFSVAIISDATEDELHRFEDNIQEEIEALMGSRYTLTFTEIYTGGDLGRITSEINRVYTAQEADVLIGAGILTNLVLSNLPEYPLPTLASILLTEEETGGEDRSGVPNFTYVNSPFDIEAGIKALEEICRCENLVVLINEDLQTIGLRPENLFASSEGSISWLTLDENLSRTVPKIAEGVEAVYILSPLSGYPIEDIKLFFDQLNERKLPSFALIDTPMLELGGYAAFATSDNLQKIPRRVALNTEKISEGQDPKDFAVSIESFSSQLVINMETANKMGKYPNWTVLDDALLVNVNKPYTSRVVNLKSVIAEGIQNNLGYQIEAKQTEINRKEVALARSNYLPSLEVESTGFFLDQNTINSSFGTRGEFNWTAGASFSQLILSEPALANIAIQKLLLESQKQVQKQSELDVILEVAQRYFTYQQAETLVELQNNNIKAINQNLAIAKDKEEVGYSGATDVYRWQTELDLAKTDLYNANAQLKAVGFQLNESLNRPIDEEFAIEGSDEMEQLIEQMDQVF